MAPPDSPPLTRTAEFDLVALGETMVRFSPPGESLLAQSPSVEMHVGGSESNTLVGMSRLGRRTAWLSRLPRHAIGDLVEKAIAAHGVSTSHVLWTPEGRVGIYYMERGAHPRAARVIYDRRESAFSRIDPNRDYVDLFGRISAAWFHTTGITLAVSKGARQCAMGIAEQAIRCGTRISFDTNYRARLWTAQEARDYCRPMLHRADLVFVPLRDLSIFFDVDPSDPPQRWTAALQAVAPRAIVVVTCGTDGALAIDGGGKVVHQPTIAVERRERLGSGDAFTAGFLATWSQTADVELALRRGNAAAALKCTIPGDLPWIDPEEVDRLARRLPASSSDPTLPPQCSDGWR